jgi:hypothetical protein
MNADIAAGPTRGERLRGNAEVKRTQRPSIATGLMAR